MEYVGLYSNARAGLNVNVILLLVWISSSRHNKISNVQMLRHFPEFYIGHTPYAILCVQFYLSLYMYIRIINLIRAQDKNYIRTRTHNDS